MHVTNIKNMSELGSQSTELDLQEDNRVSPFVANDEAKKFLSETIAGVNKQDTLGTINSLIKTGEDIRMIVAVASIKVALGITPEKDVTGTTPVIREAIEETVAMLGFFSADHFFHNLKIRVEDVIK